MGIDYWDNGSVILFDDEQLLDLAEIAEILGTANKRWKTLSLEPLGAGTDNRMYRLGPDMVLRIPRTSSSALQLHKETRWVGKVTKGLPLRSPRLICAIPATSNNRDTWALYDWIPGEPGTRDPRLNSRANALTLAQWIKALHAVPPMNGPVAGDHNFLRGENLANREQRTHALLQRHRQRFDATILHRAWGLALDSAAASHTGHGWIHGDLQPGNMLLVDGTITAIIDFGGLGIGDQACDLMACWTIFDQQNREAIRERLQVDAAAWNRGRGWALTTAIAAYDFYRDVPHPIVRQSERTLQAILEAGLP